MQFWRRGKSKAFFVPTIADVSAPTVAEIAAGTELSPAVTAIDNFETSTSRISQGVLASKVDVQIDGNQTLGDAAMTLLEGDGVSGGDETAYAAIFTALAEDATGYIVLAPVGAAATKKVEVWPVKVGAKNRVWAIDTNEMAKYRVAFAVTAAPTKAATVSA